MCDEEQGEGGGGADGPGRGPNPDWKWGDERPEGPDPSAEPMLDPETAERVAEAELLLATGRNLKDVEELLKRAKHWPPEDDATDDKS